MLQTIRYNPDLVVRVVAARQEDECGVEKRLFRQESPLSKTVDDISVFDYVALVVDTKLRCPSFPMISTG